MATCKISWQHFSMDRYVVYQWQSHFPNVRQRTFPETHQGFFLLKSIIHTWNLRCVHGRFATRQHITFSRSWQFHSLQHCDATIFVAQYFTLLHTTRDMNNKNNIVGCSPTPKPSVCMILTVPSKQPGQNPGAGNLILTEWLATFTL